MPTGTKASFSTSVGWSHRYSLEVSLLAIHRVEEIFWQQRGRLNWVLKGDALTKYFFAIANGRGRRCSIVRLIIDGVVVSDADVIMNHIVFFFSSSLAAQSPSALSISPNLWPHASLVSATENAALMIPLSNKEIDEAVASSNSNSAPTPDGFSIPFFKKNLECA